MGNLYAAMLSATVVGGLVPVPGVEQLQEWHLHHWLRHIFACTECSELRELGILRNEPLNVAGKACFRRHAIL